MISTDFEIILVPEDNRKQNWDEPYTNKYIYINMKHVNNINMLLAIIAMNWYVLMINLVSLLS